MTEPASYPLDGKQQFFLLDEEYPIRVTEPDTVPEVSVKGEWQPYYNVTRFFEEARAVSKEEFDVAVRQQHERRERES